LGFRFGEKQIIYCTVYTNSKSLQLNSHNFLKVNNIFIYFQDEYSLIVQEFLQKLRRKLPLKRVLLAFAPFLLYLIIYSNYNKIRYATGLEETRKPSITFLPWLEYFVFRCYPHRLLSKFASPLLDFFAAIPYLIHFPLPFFFSLYLLVGEDRQKNILPYLWCAGWVNLIAVTIQFLWPTAPPWFVDSVVYDHHGKFLQSGFNEAGFARLDALIGHSVFHGIYSKSPLKFGAFPSLHVAWPAIILVNNPWFGKKVAWFHVAWIAWAALYSNHHYAVDAVGGILLVFIVNLSMIKIWSPFNAISPLQRMICGSKFSNHLERIV
jgi:hypothetical protein